MSKSSWISSQYGADVIAIFDTRRERVPAILESCLKALSLEGVSGVEVSS